MDWLGCPLSPADRRNILVTTCFQAAEETKALVTGVKGCLVHLDVKCTIAPQHRREGRGTQERLAKAS